MKMYDASFDTIFLRFNLMMAVVVVPFVLDIPVVAILALPIFLSCMFGIRFFPKNAFDKPSITVYPDLSNDTMGRKAA